MFKNLNPSALGISGHQSEIIELALTYGFTGLDVNMAEFAVRVRLKGMAYARRLIDSAKIRVGTFALPLEWDTDDESFQKDLTKLSEYAGCAAELGCTCATAVLAPAGDKRPYHENFEFHRHRFHDICAVLKPAGVRLAVGFLAAEYHRRNQVFQFVHDLDALTLLLNMVGAPIWGCCWTRGRLPLAVLRSRRCASCPSSRLWPCRWPRCRPTWRWPIWTRNPGCCPWWRRRGSTW